MSSSGYAKVVSHEQWHQLSPELVEYRALCRSIYLCFIFVPLTPIGLMMAYFYRRRMVGTDYGNHMTWLIRAFWWTIIYLAILFVALVSVPMAPATIIPNEQKWNAILACYGLAVTTLAWYYLRRVFWGFVKLIRYVPIIKYKDPTPVALNKDLWAEERIETK